MVVTITLNGKKVDALVKPDTLLIDFVRDHGCYSVKRGCETSNCGLCTVFVNEKPVLSCSMLVARVNGCKVDTLEGLQKLKPAFKEGGKVTAGNASGMNDASSGVILMSEEKAKELGCGALCFEGDIDFYGKSGFRPASEFGIRYHGLGEDEGASFFLCKELIPGYLSDVTGEYATPSGYFVDEEKAEEFDKTFPKKEKKKLPEQIF